MRKQVADAILKAMVSVKGAEIVCRFLSARIYASRSVLIRLPLRRRRRTSSFALQRRWTDTRSRKARLKPLSAFPIPAQHHTRNTVAGSEPTTWLWLLAPSATSRSRLVSVVGHSLNPELHMEPKDTEAKR